ncbi:MAG: Tad domain-containing protein [Thermomicrobiaceae bacterium]
MSGKHNSTRLGETARNRFVTGAFMQPCRGSSQAHEGQVLILFAVASIVVIAFLGLAVDAGLAMSERRGAQNAADAASLAVARAMVDRGQDNIEDEATIEAYLTANGYEGAAFEWEYTDDPDGVLVEVSIEVPRVFLGAFYDGEWTVGADAVASLDTVPADYGLIALDESGNAINATGNTHVRVREGGVMSNADISCSGSSTITADTAVHAAGTVLDTSVASIACHIGGDSDTSSGRSPIEDPLAGTPEPPEPTFPTGLPSGNCEYVNESYNSVAVCEPGRYTSWSWSSGYGIRFEPGTYLFDTNVSTNPWSTGEIEMVPGGNYNFYVRNSTWEVASGTQRFDMSSTGSVNMYFQNSMFRLAGPSNVTLGSGLYHFNDSDFYKTAGARATGTDVSFFFKNGGSMIGDGYNDNFHLSAPDYELYPGMPPHMLVHAPPSNTSFRMTLEASSTNALLRGIVYMPTGDFRLAGNTGGTWAEGQLITGSFEVAGSSNGFIQYEELVEVGTPGVWLTQ